MSRNNLRNRNELLLAKHEMKITRSREHQRMQLLISLDRSLLGVSQTVLSRFLHGPLPEERGLGASMLQSLPSCPEAFAA